eukprot:406025-Pelagomonas_calceolata.AAC.3
MWLRVEQAGDVREQSTAQLENEAGEINRTADQPENQAEDGSLQTNVNQCRDEQSATQLEDTTGEV